MSWIIVDTGTRSAAENMALDAALLSDLEFEENLILHLYDWKGDAATFGHFVDPAKFLNMDHVAKERLDIARRPTGGGIVFHNCDLAFSILVPAKAPSFSINPLENYAFVNKRVIWMIQQLSKEPVDLLPQEPHPLDSSCFHFCMAKPTKYDVMVGGKKIGGAAQRKTRAGYLHQGTISIGLLPETYLSKILLPDTQVLEGMKKNSYSLLGDQWTQKELIEMRGELLHLLQKAFSDCFQG